MSGLLLRRALRRPPESGAGRPGGREAVCTVIAASPCLRVPRSRWLLSRSALLGRFHRVPARATLAKAACACVVWDPRSRVAREGRGNLSRGGNGAPRGWALLADPEALKLGTGHQGEGTVLASSCCRHSGPEPSGDLKSSPWLARGPGGSGLRLDAAGGRCVRLDRAGCGTPGPGLRLGILYPRSIPCPFHRPPSCGREARAGKGQRRPETKLWVFRSRVGRLGATREVNSAVRARPCRVLTAF